MTTELIHYGTPRHSGRYPWGSGEDPYQSSQSFLSYVKTLTDEGLSEKEIAESMNLSMRELRERKTIHRNQLLQERIHRAYTLKEKGMSNVAIGKQMNLPESTIRNLLAPSTKLKADKLDSTVDMLKAQLARNKYLDVGKGNELYLGVSEAHLKAALTKLKDEGYRVDKIKELQIGTGEDTTVLVLSPPGTTYKEVVTNKGDIGTINAFSEDKGLTYQTPKKPTSIAADRIAINYGPDGGADSDGVIYIRPGVEDISIGNKHYAQVRIAVNDTHYIKGVAVYKDDLPKGVDVVFNTNKSRTSNKLDALKPLGDDPDLPFGSVTRPRNYIDKNGKQKQSAMNIIYEEGEWIKWDKNLASQMLSKQTTGLAKKQLDLDASFRKNNLEEIQSLTNPTIRKHLLEEFAKTTDSAAAHLKAAALPRQNTHVLIPINSLRDNEVYAPNYKQGESVVLIRYPHGGIFEIPQLKVNVRNAEAKKILGNQPIDAIGINSKVAQQLSGADFDGDSVIVIPNNDGKIRASSPLRQLKDFDPKALYQRDTPTITSKNKEREMGIISNLITDMTIRGANEGELARAVKHSMVVIDSHKHNLDYKQSFLDNNIADLKRKYQADPDEPGKFGASTLISRANSDIRIPARKPRPAKDGGFVDKKTGELKYVPTGESYVNKDGETVVKKITSTKLKETTDAHTLSSGKGIEVIYANYSNELKSLANQARLEALNTPNLKYSPQAAKTYAPQVASLNGKLQVALKNAPLERRAQRLAEAQVSALKRANPEIEKDKLKTIRNKTLTQMRIKVGAKKQLIDITPDEWEAIQSGAVSNKTAREIMLNSDQAQVKKYATPRSNVTMTPAKIARAKAMARLGYPQSEIAEALGVSATTITQALQ